MDSTLIVLDGLPGSGKSTTAEWLAQQLRHNGIAVYWLQETDLSHPLWWYEFWNGTDYQPPDFDHTPIEVFIETSLEKWRSFTVQARLSDGLIVAESVFFQNAIAMFVMGGAQPALLMEYAREVQRIIGALHPVLIYFQQNDIADALRRICDLRGRDFEDELFTNMECFPYLKQRELKGFEGVTILWREISRLTDTLFEEYRIPKLRIENSAGDWLSYQQQILAFLGLPLQSK